MLTFSNFFLSFIELTKMIIHLMYQKILVLILSTNASKHSHLKYIYSKETIEIFKCQV